jgi:phosphotransacetylase
MALLSFDELYRRANARHVPVPVSVAGAADATVLDALHQACARGWITPLAVGDAAEIRRIAAERGLDLRGFTLIDSAEPAAAAVELVQKGSAPLLMKGQVGTPTLLHAVLAPGAGLRTGRTICQVVLMEVGQRRFLLADTGICIQPTLEQKVDILHSAVEVAAALAVPEPHIALMAATELVLPAMPETLDAAELQRRGRAGELGRSIVRGPLSFDLAYDAEAALKKKLDDPAFGVADIMLFPNLLAANLTVKAIMYTATCRFGGVLRGAACPVVFMSRADTAATRLNSLALALALVST